MYLSYWNVCIESLLYMNMPDLIVQRLCNVTVISKSLQMILLISVTKNWHLIPSHHNSQVTSLLCDFSLKSPCPIFECYFVIKWKILISQWFILHVSDDNDKSKSCICVMEISHFGLIWVTVLLGCMLKNVCKLWDVCM